MKRWLLAMAAGALVAVLSACGGSSADQSTATVAPRPTPTPTTAAAPTATLLGAAPTATATATPTRAAVTATPTGAVATATPTKAASTSTPTGGGSSQVTIIDTTSDPYLFVPDTFTFQAGKTYILKFKPPKEFHTFTASSLNLDIQIYPGESPEQTVTFNDIGTFQVICIVHEQLGQTGKIIVTGGG